ncbi:MAG: LPS export ABC transporter permease LptF [Hyphomicrobiaceae bacterium]
MSLFGRYMFRQALGAFLMVLLSLTAIVWIATALKQLTLLTSQGQDAFVFIKMTLLAIPNLMALIAPIALLIAALHTLNRLNTDSELIVMTASGSSIWRIAQPLAVLALLVAVSVLIANHLVLPWSVRTLQDYIVRVRTDLISQVIQPGEFSSPEPGLTFHIRDRDRDGRLYGLLMSDESDPRQSITYLAETGRIVERGPEALLIMETGHILRRQRKEKAASIIRFENYVVDLKQFGAKEAAEVLKPRARSTVDLFAPDPTDPLYKQNPGSFRSELHERFASPLYPLAFIAIAIAFVGQARTNRQGRIRSLITAFATAAAVRVLGFAAMNMATLSAGAVLLLYGIPLGAISLAVIVAWRQMTPRPPSRLTNAIERLSGLVGPWLRRSARGAGPLTTRRRTA